MQIVHIERPINAHSAERLYCRAQELADEHRLAKAERAMRIARAGERKLLQVLEKLSNVMDRIFEDQRGQTSRQASRPIGERVYAHEAKVWQEAYRLMDKGEPSPHLAWYYAAAAEHAGLV